MTERFLPYTDELAERIQAQCTTLFRLMQSIKVKEIGLSEHGVQYFLGSHYKRLFFSIETSAHLLYHSIRCTGKNTEDIVIMDYGAGVGSLYLLAKMIGCKKVLYNDLLEHWKDHAFLIAQAINIDLDEWIVGDIETTLQILQHKQIECDIITSRNVIEHIYKLDVFYKTVHHWQPNALVYSSTTANFYNPAMNIKHVLLHKRIEKVYLQKRIQLITAHNPQLNSGQVEQLAKQTKGYNVADLYAAVDAFVSKGTPPVKGYYYTNTCEPDWGIWAENILPFGIHKKMIRAGNMQAGFRPGFWDTHYSKPWKNVLSRGLNSLIRGLPFTGYLLAPFIYVIALPENKNSPL